MKAEYVNPFIASVHDLFTTMLGCTAERGQAKLDSEPESEPRRVVALIGLSGPARGTVALAFPLPTALAIVGRLVGEEPTDIDDEALDAVSEVVNIVAGGAKARLSAQDGPPIELGLPTTIVGDNYTVVPPSDATWLDLPFASELGGFNLRVAFEPNGKH